MILANPQTDMIYDVTHITRYVYDGVVPTCQNLARLHPPNLPYQTCLHHELLVDPNPTEIFQRTDYFGNVVNCFNIREPLSELTVSVRNRVEVTPRIYPAPLSTPAWDSIAGHIPADDLLAQLLVHPSPHIRRSQAFGDYARLSFVPGRPIADAAIDLTSRLFHEYTFDAEATTVSTPIEEVFRNRAGVCQDFAHLQIAMLRSIGLPARYVSGYLRTIPPPGKQRLVGADASHAWISVFCGSAGWLDLDPTNNLVPGTDYATTAIGRDYFDVSPVQGVFVGGGKTVLKASVDMLPLPPGDPPAVKPLRDVKPMRELETIEQGE